MLVDIATSVSNCCFGDRTVCGGWSVVEWCGGAMMTVCLGGTNGSAHILFDVLMEVDIGSVGDLLGPSTRFHQLFTAQDMGPLEVMVNMW